MAAMMSCSEIYSNVIYVTTSRGKVDKRSCLFALISYRIAMAQKPGTLHSFFTKSSKRKATEIIDEEPPFKRPPDSQKKKSSAEEAEKNSTTRTRRWLQQWEKQFPWLEKKVVGPRHDVDVLAVCKWCRDAGKKNAFALGSPSLKADCFTRHETRNPDHTGNYLLQ